MFERVKHMLIKEFIQIFRDRRMRAIIFLFPIIQTLLFGYAVTTDVKNVKMGIYDSDNSPASRLFLSNIHETEYFDVVKNIHNDKEVDKILDNGEATIVLHLKNGFEGDIRRSEPVTIQTMIDGTDSNTAGIIENYIFRIAADMQEKYLPYREVKARIKPKIGVMLESRAWFNSNLESRNYYVPGVIATVATLVTLTLTSMAIVREKEIGTMEQIMVTPIKKLEFILGKTVPFMIIGLLDIIMILCVALFWFEVPFYGNIFLLFLAAFFYLLTILGVGLFISTLCQTQQQAMMFSFLVYFPMILLSGFLFPVANMPTAMQWITVFNPLKYFIVIIRSLFLKGGVGLNILWPSMLALAGMGIFTIWQATHRFKKTMT
jgi:ABC-2 type transport system permease protein